MKSIFRYKGIFFTLVILILLGVAYNMLFKTEGLPPQDITEVTLIGDEILKTREELQAVAFDNSVFSSPEFLSLIDFSVEILIQPTGRLNPFAPIGR